MAEFEAIKNQLQSFIRKYQLNLLIKNTALFILIGLLFWLLLVLFENFIWFDRSVRFLLFLFFIIVESALLIFFIGLPLIKFLDIRRGISDRKAAVLIGDYFPEIDDRLLNLIELKYGKGLLKKHSAKTIVDPCKINDSQQPWWLGNRI